MGDIIHIPKLSNETKSPSKTMTRDQVVNHFQISNSTLYRWTNVENKLPYIKINRRKLFKVDDIERLMETYHSSNN